VACPYDFWLFNGKCYKFVSEPTTIFNAQMICEKIGAELLSIHSEEEASFIASAHAGEESWIGLLCNPWDENWEWTDETAVDYVNFEDQTSNTENCQEVPETQRFGLREDLLWWKRDWNETLNFTCERDPINCPDGFAYLTNSWCAANNASVQMDYGNATNYCADMGAYLPSVESIEVSNALTVTMKMEGEENFWIGLLCSEANTTWYWSDHCPYSPTQAMFATPTDTKKCQPYVRDKYAMNIQGKWQAFDYTNQFPYVICTIAPLPMPTEAPDLAHCPPGYIKFRGHSPADDWCFAMTHPLPLENKSTANFTDAKQHCENRGELLPVVTSSQMTIFLRRIRASFDIVRKSPFWIGLQCADNGWWVWSDGTPLDPGYTQWYGNTQPQCDEGYRVVFNDDGKWTIIPDGNGQHLIICATKYLF
ncbi:hypothetical protein PENTCL1PPCAC_21488, partial [Pristionchus entomophagus]